MSFCSGGASFPRCNGYSVPQTGSARVICQHGRRSCAWMRSDALPSFTETDPELKEGIRIAQFFAPEPENRRSLKFVRNFRVFAGRNPDYGSAFAYDALYLVRDAVLHGGFSREGVKSYLDHMIREGARVDGVAGSFHSVPIMTLAGRSTWRKSATAPAASSKPFPQIRSAVHCGILPGRLFLGPRWYY